MQTKQRLVSLLLLCITLLVGCGRGAGGLTPPDWPLVGSYVGSLTGAWNVGGREQPFGSSSAPLSILPDQANQVVIVDLPGFGCRFTAQSEGFIASARPGANCSIIDQTDPTVTTFLTLNTGSAYGSPTQITVTLSGTFIASKSGRPYATGTFRVDYTGLRPR